jgi:hypothetical protein
MGEAKRRREWIAAGGEDWGRVGWRSFGRWGGRIRGLDKEAIAKLELERDQRRGQQKANLFGLLGFATKGIALSKSAISRLTAVRAQLKKRGASSAARRAFR